MLLRIIVEPTPKTPAEGLEYVLLTGAGVKAPAASATSFSSMEEALQAVARHQFQPAEAVDKEVNLIPQYEIVCRRPGESVRSGKKPRHQFYVNVWSSDPGSIEGEGTESFPWSGVNSAVAALLGRCKRERLRLKPGQRLLISHKEPFTPSALERRKKIKETIAKYVFLAMTCRPGVAGGSDSGIFSGQSMAGIVVFIPFPESHELHDRRRHLGALDRHIFSGAACRW